MAGGAALRLRAPLIEKWAELDDLAEAWDEGRVRRAKTTPRSNRGSFAPRLGSRPAPMRPISVRDARAHADAGLAADRALSIAAGAFSGEQSRVIDATAAHVHGLADQHGLAFHIRDVVPADTGMAAGIYDDELGRIYLGAARAKWLVDGNAPERQIARRTLTHEMLHGTGHTIDDTWERGARSERAAARLAIEEGTVEALAGYLTAGEPGALRTEDLDRLAGASWYADIVDALSWLLEGARRDRNLPYPEDLSPMAVGRLWTLRGTRPAERATLIARWSGLTVEQVEGMLAAQWRQMTDEMGLTEAYMPVDDARSASRIRAILDDFHASDSRRWRPTGDHDRVGVQESLHEQAFVPGAWHTWEDELALLERWDEGRVHRAKTTPRSNRGSFAPRYIPGLRDPGVRAEKARRRGTRAAPPEGRSAPLPTPEPQPAGRGQPKPPSPAPPPEPSVQRVQSYTVTKGTPIGSPVALQVDPTGKVGTLVGWQGDMAMIQWEGINVRGARVPAQPESRKAAGLVTNVAPTGAAEVATKAGTAVRRARDAADQAFKDELAATRAAGIPSRATAQMVPDRMEYSLPESGRRRRQGWVIEQDLDAGRALVFDNQWGALTVDIAGGYAKLGGEPQTSTGRLMLDALETHRQEAKTNRESDAHDREIMRLRKRTADMARDRYLTEQPEHYTRRHTGPQPWQPRRRTDLEPAPHQRPEADPGVGTPGAAPERERVGAPTPGYRMAPTAGVSDAPGPSIAALANVPSREERERAEREQAKRDKRNAAARAKRQQARDEAAAAAAAAARAAATQTVTQARAERGELPGGIGNIATGTQYQLERRRQLTAEQAALARDMVSVRGALTRALEVGTRVRLRTGHEGVLIGHFGGKTNPIAHVFVNSHRLQQHEHVPYSEITHARRPRAAVKTIKRGRALIDKAGGSSWPEKLRNAEALYRDEAAAAVRAAREDHEEREAALLDARVAIAPERLAGLRKVVSRRAYTQRDAKRKATAEKVLREIAVQRGRTSAALAKLRGQKDPRLQTAKKPPAPPANLEFPPVDFGEDFWTPKPSGLIHDKRELFTTWPQAEAHPEHLRAGDDVLYAPEGAPHYSGGAAGVVVKVNAAKEQLRVWNPALGEFVDVAFREIHHVRHEEAWLRHEAISQIGDEKVRERLLKSVGKEESGPRLVAAEGNTVADVGKPTFFRSPTWKGHAPNTPTHTAYRWPPAPGDSGAAPGEPVTSRSPWAEKNHYRGGTPGQVVQSDAKGYFPGTPQEAEVKAWTDMLYRDEIPVAELNAHGRVYTPKTSDVTTVTVNTGTRRSILRKIVTDVPPTVFEDLDPDDAADLYDVAVRYQDFADLADWIKTVLEARGFGHFLEPESKPAAKRKPAAPPKPAAGRGRLTEGRLSSGARDQLPESAFALPGRRYPIHDESHARNALSRVSQHGTPEEKRRVRAAVRRRYPNIGATVEAALVEAAKAESPFVSWARDELERAGLFETSSDYEGMVGKAVMRLIEQFSGQGHSGFSAGMVASIFKRLSEWKALTPLTSDPGEWQHIAEEMAGQRDLWQSRRQPDAFSNDGGKTYYLLEDREERYEKDGVSWSRRAPEAKWKPLRTAAPPRRGRAMREARAVAGMLEEPFKSAKQREYLRRRHPELYKKWKRKYGDQPQREASVGSSMMMVALYPSPELAQRLAVAGGEAPDTLHVTLAYLGKPDRGTIPRILETARLVAAGAQGPMHGTVAGSGTFTGGPDGTVAYASIDLPALPDWREQLVRRLDEAGVPVSRAHGFTPHMTIRYGAPIPPIAAHPIAFDRVCVVRGDRKLGEFPLGLSLQEADAPAIGVNSHKLEPGDGPFRGLYRVNARPFVLVTDPEQPTNYLLAVTPNADRVPAGVIEAQLKSSRQRWREWEMRHGWPTRRGFRALSADRSSPLTSRHTSARPATKRPPVRMPAPAIHRDDEDRAERHADERAERAYRKVRPNASLSSVRKTPVQVVGERWETLTVINKAALRARDAGDPDERRYWYDRMQRDADARVFGELWTMSPEARRLYLLHVAAAKQGVLPPKAVNLAEAEALVETLPASDVEQWLARM